MSNQEFENYLALIGKLLQLSRNQRDQIAGELRDHLQMRVADLEGEGTPRQDAIRQALEEFGDAAAMAKNFQSVINHKKRRQMMRFVTFSIAGSFLVAVLLMAMWPSQSHFGAPSTSIAQDNKAVEKTESKTEPPIRFSPGTEATIKTERALKRVVDLEYDQTPWSEVEEDLELRLGVNFLLSISAMDDSLTEDEPVTINLAGIPLSKALTLMLATKNATYVIDDGVVIIISLDDAEDVKWFRLKMYDCRDLVAVLPKRRENFGGGGYGGAGRGGGGGGVFSVAQGVEASQKGKASGSKPKADAPNASALLDKKLNQILSLMKSDLEKNLTEPTSEQTLVNLVQSMVAPDTWKSTGQGLGAIDAVNGILIVSQSEQVHQQIEKLLADLEANVLGRTKVDARATKIENEPLKKAKASANSTGKVAKPSAPQDSDPFAVSSDPDSDPFE